MATSPSNELRVKSRQVLQKFVLQELPKFSDDGGSDRPLSPAHIYLYGRSVSINADFRKLNTEDAQATLAKVTVSDGESKRYRVSTGHRSDVKKISKILRLREKSLHAAETRHSKLNGHADRKSSFADKSMKSDCSVLSHSSSTCSGMVDGKTSYRQRPWTTSGGGTGSSSSPDDLQSSYAKASSTKKKKSLFKRARERLARTFARKHEYSFSSSKDSTKTVVTKKKVRQTRKAEVVDQHVYTARIAGGLVDPHSEFSTLTLSDIERRMQQATDAGQATTLTQPDFGSLLTPPDSVGRRPKRRYLSNDYTPQVSKFGNDGPQDRMNTSLMRVRISTVKQKAADKADRVQGYARGYRFSDATGLEILADQTPPSPQNGIVHRISSEFDMATPDSRDASGVQIHVQPPSSSSPSKSLTPPKTPSDEPSGPAASSSEVSSPRDLLAHNASAEDKYALIARRLAELGDSFLTERDAHFKALGQPSGLTQTRRRASSVEREMISFINQCGAELQNRHDILRQLVNSDTAQQFGEVLSTITERPVESAGWTQLAVIFQLTTAAVNVVGASTNAAGRIIDFCLDFIERRFSDWIISRGGWESLVDDSTDDG